MILPLQYYGKPVLRDVTLKIPRGSFHFLTGGSGAGKSTLLNILGLLDEANEGEYFLYDQPVHRLKEKKKVEYHRNLIGFIFQAYHLIDELNVYENIEIRRPATTGWCSPGHHQQSETAVGRRTDRKFAFRPGKSHHGATSKPQPKRRNDHHTGDPLRRKCQLRQSYYKAGRRHDYI